MCANSCANVPMPEDSACVELPARVAVGKLAFGQWLIAACHDVHGMYLVFAQFAIGWPFWSSAWPFASRGGPKSSVTSSGDSNSICPNFPNACRRMTSSSYRTAVHERCGAPVDGWSMQKWLRQNSHITS